MIDFEWISATAETPQKSIDELDFKLKALPDWCIMVERWVIGHTAYQAYRIPENQEDLIS